jgi:hypothetical protein
MLEHEGDKPPFEERPDRLLRIRKFLVEWAYANQ